MTSCLLFCYREPDHSDGVADSAAGARGRGGRVPVQSLGEPHSQRPLDQGQPGTYIPSNSEQTLEWPERVCSKFVMGF